MLNTAQTRKAKRAFTLIEIMIVVLIIGILLGIAVPNFIRARESARAKSCIANLKAIDGAFQQAIMQRNVAASNTTVPEIADLVGMGFLKSLPACPSSGTYTLINVNSAPSCSIGGTAGTPLAHTLP